MTEAQIEQIHLRNAKIACRHRLEVLWRNQLAAGIEVGGITLAATENDQAAFTRLLTLLREVESLQPDETARAAFLGSPQVITDMRGLPRTQPSVGALRQLLVAYGAAIRDLWTAYAAKRASAEAATSQTELDAIMAAD